jgi:hypothetical protein
VSPDSGKLLDADVPADVRQERIREGALNVALELAP